MASVIRVINKQVNHILDNPRFHEFPKTFLIPYYETFALWHYNYLNFILQRGSFQPSIRTYISQTSEDLNKLLDPKKDIHYFYPYVVNSTKDKNVVAEALLFTGHDIAVKKLLEDLHMGFIDQHDNIFTHPTQFNFTVVDKTDGVKKDNNAI